MLGVSHVLQCLFVLDEAQGVQCPSLSLPAHQDKAAKLIPCLPISNTTNTHSTRATAHSCAHAFISASAAHTPRLTTPSPPHPKPRMRSHPYLPMLSNVTNMRPPTWFTHRRNDYGQLGLGDINNRGDQPGEMGAALPPVDLGL